MLWMSLLLACTDDFKNMDQNITPLDTSELNSDDTGPDTGDIEDTIDTADTTETDEPVDDLDGDGWTEDEGDCDDNDPSVNPDALDNDNDGEDDNCNGEADENWVDPANQDTDGDGFTEGEGDCNDNNPNINPEATEVCDGVDNDCDGSMSDIAVDQWEPNSSWTFGDLNAVNYLGDLDDGDTIEVDNYHFPQTDIDTFVFFDEDGWFDSFHFTVTLYQIHPDIELTMSVEWFEENGTSQGIIGTATGNGPGTNVVFDYEGDTGSDDTGYYVVTIASNVGESCDTPYIVKLEED